MNCRVMTLKKNSFTYYAGCAWSKAGEITTATKALELDSFLELGFTLCNTPDMVLRKV